MRLIFRLCCAGLLFICLTIITGCGETSPTPLSNTSPAPPAGPPSSPTSSSMTDLYGHTLGGAKESPAVTARRELPADAPRFKLLTWNINYGGPGAADAAKIIRDADADVVCLQETTDAWAALLRRDLGDLYPNQVYRSFGGAGGQGILSKKPLSNVALIQPRPTPPENAPPADKAAATGGWFPGWIVAADTPAGKVQLCNVHLRPPFDDKGGVTMASLLASETIHKKELESYLERKSPDLPLFVCGDFNENDGGGGMKYLEAEKLTDALSQFDQLANTWHWQLPSIYLTGRYDHILHPASYICTAAKVIKKGDSDHYPVLAEFAPARQ